MTELLNFVLFCTCFCFLGFSQIFFLSKTRIALYLTWFVQHIVISQVCIKSTRSQPKLLIRDIRRQHCRSKVKHVSQLKQTMKQAKTFYRQIWNFKQHLERQKPHPDKDSMLKKHSIYLMWGTIMYTERHVSKELWKSMCYDSQMLQLF